MSDQSRIESMNQIESLSYELHGSLKYIDSIYDKIKVNCDVGVATLTTLGSEMASAEAVLSLSNYERGKANEILSKVVAKMNVIKDRLEVHQDTESILHQELLNDPSLYDSSQTLVNASRLLTTLTIGHSQIQVNDEMSASANLLLGVITKASEANGAVNKLTDAINDPINIFRSTLVVKKATPAA
jgi:hypothetical protein